MAELLVGGRQQMTHPTHFLWEQGPQMFLLPAPSLGVQNLYKQGWGNFWQSIGKLLKKLMVSMSYVYTLNLLFSWTTELSEKQVILRNYTSVGKQGPSKITS